MKSRKLHNDQHLDQLKNNIENELSKKEVGDKSNGIYFSVIISTFHVAKINTLNL